MTQTTRPPNYAAFLWHALFLSVTVTFTDLNSVIPAMILQVGGGEIHVGAASAIMIGIPLVTKLFFAGILHSRRRKKPALLAGIHMRVLALGLISATLLAAPRLSVARGLAFIYGELLLFTLGGAFAGIAYVDLVGKSFSREVRARFFTRKQILSAWAVLASAVIARQLLAVLTYPRNYAILFAAAAAGLILAAGGFWKLREAPSAAGPSRGFRRALQSIPAILREDANLRNYVLFTNFLGFHTALIPFYVALAKNRYYLDPGLAGTLLLLQIAGMVAASFLWPRLVRRYGYAGVLRTWTGMALLLPAASLLVSRWLPLPFYAALFLFSGAANGARRISQDAVIIELSPPEERVLYSGIWGTLNLSAALYPLLLGALLSLWGYPPVFLAVSASAGLAGLFLHRICCPGGLED